MMNYYISITAYNLKAVELCTPIPCGYRYIVAAEDEERVQEVEAQEEDAAAASAA
jgi:hypothetical protein